MTLSRNILINYSPNRFLGQNFLTSRRIIEEIVHAADIKPSDVILEVGPGKGILTEELVKRAGKVIAIEKDKRMVDYLGALLPSGLEIIHADILKFNLESYKLKTKRYKIVANIPYYITSRLLRKFLESDNQPSLMVLMVQKEVADRIVARDKKESILSISVKAYGQPKIIKKVPAKYFSPQPKVDSAILLIDNISKKFFSAFGGADENRFFKLVRTGFSHKRKLLKNNLSQVCQGLPLIPRVVLGVFRRCGIEENARAENLSLENWKCLYKNLPVS